MISYFKQDSYIHTDRQHIEVKQASMIVQEKEPLSPQKKKGCKSLVICTLLLLTSYQGETRHINISGLCLHRRGSYGS